MPSGHHAIEQHNLCHPRIGAGHVWSCVQPWIIWGCATLFYLFQFILRVSPSVMAQDLMTTFQIDAATVGSIGASAYFSYSIAQIPAGLLLDQWGVRRTILVMLFLCVMGCWGFAYAPNVTCAKIARFCIGLGSAGGFLGCAKIAHLWFPARRTGLVLGLTVAIGTIGAICGGQPLSRLIQAIGWRMSMNYLVLVGCCVAFVMIVIVREPHHHKKHQQDMLVSPRKRSVFWKALGERLRVVLACPTAWASACVGVGVYLILSVVADMWGGMYLQQVYHLSPDCSAELISTIYVGLLVGAPLLPWLSTMTKSRKKPLWGALVVASIGWVWLFFMPSTLSEQGLRVLFFVMGVTAGGQIIPFSIVADMVPQSHVAMATAFVNMAAMLAGSILQYIAGFVLDHFWAGAYCAEGVRLYPPHAFQWALGGFGILMILSILMLKGMKETYSLKPH